MVHPFCGALVPKAAKWITHKCAIMMCNLNYTTLYTNMVTSFAAP